MNSTRLKSALVWQSPKGRDLIRVMEGGNDATVTIGVASEDELRSLAAACIEAADQIHAYANDAAIAATDEVATSPRLQAAKMFDNQLTEALQAVGL